MKTVTISYTYNVKHLIKGGYCLTECGKVINLQRGVEVTQFLRGKHKAVYISGVAYFIDELPIEKKPIDCPF